MSSTTPTHAYAVRVAWDGNGGEGTASYESYGRQYRVCVEGKPDLAGTADPAFRGEMNKHNPEELFLAALSACHMLFYLALCARNGICVVAYEDRALGQITSDSRGGGRFESITLRPHVTVDAKGRVALARSLHGTAHERCFIANSCSVPIRIVSAVEER